MKLLAGASGTAAAMLRFLIFTACRANEAVEGQWSEIDRPGSTWKIPGERMKMDQDHYVPLTDPALAVLDEMRGGRQGELILANPDGGAFSENAMLAVLDRLGYGHVTVHGFRSTSQLGLRNAPTIRMAYAKLHWPTNTRARPPQPISEVKSSKSAGP